MCKMEIGLLIPLHVDVHYFASLQFTCCKAKAKWLEDSLIDY